MSNQRVRPWAAFIATVGSLAFAASAQAATLAVDDDGVDCPAAAFTSVQAAIDAAAPGDTIAICAGRYAEGTGAVGTNALTITKNLTIKGAGADLVSISPKASGSSGGQIMETTPDIRNGVGDIVSVVGAPTQPITVDISGVTVDGYDPTGKPVAVEAGIVYLDAKGSIVRSRVTNTVTSEGDTAFNQVGGYRGAQPGIGIVQTSAARVAPVDGTRSLNIDLTRVDKYNRYGILIDGAQNDTAPLTTSGTINRGALTGDQVVGRTQCINFSGTGDCSTVGPVTTGPLFGQDGVRITSGARAQVTDSLISQNLVNGTGAPTRDTVASPNTNPPTPATTGTNNQNLTLGAGIRLVGARLTTDPVVAGLARTYNSSVTRSNITDNAYGAINVTSDGTTAQSGTGNVFSAENNWWGLRIRTATTPGNPGPAISPTNNPPFPENPVNGTPVADTYGPNPTGTTGSSAVDFQPYRAGVQSDGDAGEFPVLQAPLPVNDAAPTGVTITAGSATVAPGGTVTLTVAAADDFGVKRVRMYDGTTVVGDVRKPPYTQLVTVPADAACNSTKTYTALATDSIDQTTNSASAPAGAAGRSAAITVTCPTAPAGGSGPGGTTTTPPGTTSTPPGTTTTPPGASLGQPTIKFTTIPKTVKRGQSIALTVSAPKGIAAVAVSLGDRVVCKDASAPYTCKAFPTGADVGRQALTAVVVDRAGVAATVSVAVTVPKFKPTVSLKISRTSAGALVKRTIRGTLALPTGVSKAQGCKSGKATVVIKRAGRTFLNQQVSVSKSCTFTRSVTAAKAKQRFSVSARFSGNAVLAIATTSRRFS